MTENMNFPETLKRGMHILRLTGFARCMDGATGEGEHIEGVYYDEAVGRVTHLTADEAEALLNEQATVR